MSLYPSTIVRLAGRRTPTQTTVFDLAPLPERWLNGTPLRLINESRRLTALIPRTDVDVQGILSAGREPDVYGLDRLRYAVPEATKISIIPRQSGEATTAHSGPLAHSRE